MLYFAWLVCELPADFRGFYSFWGVFFSKISSWFSRVYAGFLCERLVGVIFVVLSSAFLRLARFRLWPNCSAKGLMSF